MSIVLASVFGSSQYSVVSELIARGQIDFYLTEKTSVDDIRQAAAGDVVKAVKLYPAGATTNSDAGVRAIDRVIPVLEAVW